MKLTDKEIEKAAKMLGFYRDVDSQLSPYVWRHLGFAKIYQSLEMVRTFILSDAGVIHGLIVLWSKMDLGKDGELGLIVQGGTWAVCETQPPKSVLAGWYDSPGEAVIRALLAHGGEE